MLTQKALLSRKRCLLYWYKSTHADAEGAAQPEALFALLVQKYTC
jgi:hypothetical protein